MEENFIPFSLDIVLKYNDAYSLRTYEILKQSYMSSRNGEHAFSFKLTEWKEMVGADELSLSIFKNSAREISKYSEFLILYKIKPLAGIVIFRVYDKEEIGIRYIEQ